MKKITLLIFLLFNFSIYGAYADTDPLKNIYTQLQAADKANHPEFPMQDVTYSLTTGNKLYDNFLSVYPGTAAWGMAAARFPMYGFDTDPNTGDADFGLPHCSSDSDCMSNAKCLHLTAFDNSSTPSSVKMCTGMADRNLSGIYDLVISAHHFVDITTLEHFPDNRFKATLRNALTTLAKSGKPITVRLLDGIYAAPTEQQSSTINTQQEYNALINTTKGELEDLTRDVGKVPNEQLTVYIAGMRSCSGPLGTTCASKAASKYMGFSWNHSKLIDVDGISVMDGGVNMFATNYLQQDPVFDLMAEVSGPAAEKTLGFTNMLWDFVNKYMRSYPQDVIEFQYQHGNITSNVPAPKLQQTANIPPPGKVEVLNIGRTGGGILPNGVRKNASDLAFYLLLSSAQKTMYIAQQSLNGSLNTWPFDQLKNASGETIAHTNLLSAIANLLVKKNGQVYIVTSPTDTLKVPLELGYESLATKEQIWDKIKAEAMAISPSSVGKLCGHLHIANIQFNDNDIQWPDTNKQIFDHYKFMMVDDHLFYFGSQNFYPSGLQNYGYIVDDPSGAASTTMKNSLWNPLWGYSKHNEYQSPDCKS